MKIKERNKARKLRLEKGWAVKRIAKNLGVSTSSVSLWVRDITLTKEQMEQLDDNKARGAVRAGKAKYETHHKIRLQYQEKGKNRVKKIPDDALHMAGCMLYWAEGSKDRNTVRFSNSDSDMCKLFLRFLEECYGVKKTEITLHCLFHSGNSVTVEEVESYWIKELKLPRTCLRKTTVIKKVAKTDHRKNKILYGVCQIRIGNTELVQNIFGAIQEYGNFTNKQWVD